jgi:carboxyl-terminal processing protease
MKKILYTMLILLAITAGACKKEVEPVVTTSEEIRGRDLLYGLMTDWYYWYKVMPVVDPKDYSDAYTLMNAMRYKALDKWSFVTDYASFTAYYEGNFVGHGIRIGLDTEDKARIAMIYQRSPLYAEGVRRGWIVKSINGTDIAALLTAGDIATYNTVMQPQTAGIINNFVFTRPDGTDVSLASAKAEFDVNSVLKYDTLHLSNGVTGYLAFEAFIEPSFVELEEAFAFFKTNDIKDLILDLRYNSGGLLDVATELASYIAGNNNAGKVFTKSDHNDRHTSENSSELLISTGYSLNLTRLAVITTRETASASENVINGLLPYVDVKCFGDSTGGKPVGMYAFNDNEKKFIFAPVTFKLVNANNEGDYFDGFIPFILAPDDITRDFGDREELSVSAAIEYLEGGGAKGFRLPVYSPSRLAPGRPAWQHNTFIRIPDSGK